MKIYAAPIEENPEQDRTKDLLALVTRVKLNAISHPMTSYSDRVAVFLYASKALLFVLHTYVIDEELFLVVKEDVRKHVDALSEMTVDAALASIVNHLETLATLLRDRVED